MHNPKRSQHRLFAFLALAASVIFISSIMRGQETVEPVEPVEPPPAPAPPPVKCFEFSDPDHNNISGFPVLIDTCSGRVFERRPSSTRWHEVVVFYR